jgi:hypothetical protein
MSILSWAWENVLPIVAVASPLVNLLLLVFWSQVPSRKELRSATAKLHARIDKVAKDIIEGDQGMDRRVTKVENSLISLATKDDITKVLLALSKQDGQRSTLEAKVDGMRTQITALETPLGLIQEHLLRASAS